MPIGFIFNPPDNWPAPPPGWEPEPGWVPDPAWPAAPAGWVFWVPVPPAPSEPPLGIPSSTDTLAPEPNDLLAPSPDHDDLTPSTISTPVAERPAPPERDEHAEPQQVDTPPLSEPHPEPPASTGTVEELAAPSHPAPAATPTADVEEDLDGRRAELAALEAQLIELNDALMLQQVGIYEYHHPLENADAYRERLQSINEHIREMIRTGAAIHASDRFAYNNSLAQGRKMTADFSKLMLRAFNAEADACVRSLRAGTSAAALKRLESAATTIAKLGRMMDMSVTQPYQDLRAEEIALTSDYLMKVQEERERAREERDQLREERRVEAELAAERELLDKERSHYERTLQTLLAQGKTVEASDVQARLAEIITAIEQNDYRKANIRAGYVYVISNIGAFGPDIVKIGLTRRLEPMDRIRELGDASVPFPFDVHALYFSDDAVTLENQLHAAFADRRVNNVNLRREYFFATPDQVRLELAQRVGNLLEFSDIPEATQYNLSRSRWPGASTSRRAATEESLPTHTSAPTGTALRQ